MRTEDILILAKLVADHVPHIVLVLLALVPVLALCVAGYAIHAVIARDRRTRR